ncbi:MAG: glycerophosphodiester phosphodiesterase [Anaerovibrio sp.]|uniref:glycerophosphodiester phosphodiesterase family protein n=1 Tax=Anaerovibrio sp. TaxID=1872532 RepID=UPI0025CD195B|nr:glycerophosphodiester phosphodiesterase family protein [Anaerovibrio sp.]MCR5176296.1 glycerophosphodiester phosphodiesterase [Anaerovibrio sp.]
MKISKKHALAAGVLAAVATMGIQSFVAPAQVEAKADLDTYFDFEPHRGGRDARPENTLYSYAYAIEMGATSIECDMQLTGDNQIVMSHNPVLNHDITRHKGTNNYVEAGKYDIRTMTVAQIKQFDVGVMDPISNPEHYYNGHGKSQVTPACAEIPTVDELFQLCKDSGFKGNLNIETKSYPDPEYPEGYKNNADPKKFVKVFYEKVKKYNMQDHVILQSFDWATLIEMKKVDSNIAVSALWCEQPTWGRDSECIRMFEPNVSPWLGGLDVRRFPGSSVNAKVINAAHSFGAEVISPYYPEISTDDVDLAHSLGMKVVPWTVNSLEAMDQLYNMGVDGMISDKPWILRAYLEKKGAKLRPTKKVAVAKYHLEPNHREISTDKMAGGTDAAY